MTKEIVVTKKNVEHPLEGVFDIEPGSTEITRVEQRTTLVSAEQYDGKDIEIENDIQEVYDKAMSGYGRIEDEVEDIEGRYKARMLEVGVQHLKLALDAASTKARMKELKDKLSVRKNNPTGPKTVNQNLFVNREDLLKALQQDDEEK